MKDATIRDAKGKLTSLVREAEAGERIRLTRRGRPVAMLVSLDEFERMQGNAATKPDFFEFLERWRADMTAQGIPFAAPEEFERDRSPGREFSFDE